MNTVFSNLITVRLAQKARLSLLTVLALAALAAPRLSLAQTITFPNPAVQVPWATGKTAFGHIKSKTGPLDVLASGLGQFPNYAQVWLNDGSGNFTLGAQLPVGSGICEGFTLGDANGDGLDDAILVSRGEIDIYLNNGDGTFTPSAYPVSNSSYFPKPFGGIQPIRVAAGKTSTGKWNIAITGAGDVAWGLLYSVNSGGTLAPNPQVLLTGAGYPTTDLEFVDVNQTGVPALVVKAVWGSPVAVFGNDGSGNFGNSGTNGTIDFQIPTFTLPAVDGNYFKAGVQFIDMDNDGTLDMVVVSADGTNGWVSTVYWYKGLGHSAFDSTPHTAWAGGPLPALEWNNGTDQWIAQAYSYATAADIDGDGKVDLAMSCQVCQPIILKNNGDGTFTKAWAASLTDSTGFRAFAEHMYFLDLTGTGQKSLIGANDTNNSFQYYTPFGEFYGSPGPAQTPTMTTVSCPTSVTYTGSAQTPCTATVTGAGGLNQSLPVTYSNNTNIGTATASASYSGDTNHTGSGASANFSIIYAFGGWLQPIPLPVSTFKAGSTIPVKFVLTNATGAPVSTAVASVSINGGASLGTAQFTGNHYQFNLQTKGMAVGPLTITVTLDDGTSHSVTVTLK